MEELIYRVTRYGGLIYCFGMAPLAAMAVFSGMYEEKRAGVFAALPIRRESSFCSLTLAGLIPQLAAHLTAAVLAAFVALAHGCFLWTPILTFLGITTLFTLCFYGFAVFCAQLTGQLLIVPAVYAVLEFTAPAVELLIRWLLSLFLYGYEGGDIGEIGRHLSPFLGLYQHTAFFVRMEGDVVAGCEFRGWIAALIYATTGAALLAVSLLLYRKRRTETAGDTVAVRPLKKVFSCALGVGCALVLSAVLTSIFSGSNLPEGRTILTAVGFLLGGFIGYFGAEMLMRKSFRVFGDCRRGGVILLAGLMLLLAVMRFDVFGLERRLPGADKIQSVQIHTSEGETAELREPENIEKALALNIYVLDHRTREEGLYSYLRIRYVCDGRNVVRCYRRLPTADSGAEGAQLAGLLEELYNCDEALYGRFPREADKKDFHYTELQFWEAEGPDGRTDFQSVEITAEQAYEWYTTCVLPDVEDGVLGRIYFDETRAPKTYNAECWLELYREKAPQGTAVTENAYRLVLVVPNTQSTRTNEWLKAHGVELYLRQER